MEFRTKVDEEGNWVNVPRHFKLSQKKNFANKTVRVRITELKRRASKGAHGYYRVIVLPSIVWRLADLGNDINPYEEKDIEFVHRFLVRKFSRYQREFCDANGEVHGANASLEGIPAENMSDFLQRVIEWAAESLQIFIPTSDKDWNKKTGQLKFWSALENDYPNVKLKYSGL